MKIRIFTLAKELNMDSKILIGYCQKLGINLKDSPLASVSEEERDRVLAFIKQGSPHNETAAKTEELAPTREPVKSVAGKVPSIRPLAVRQPTRDRRDEVDESAIVQPVPAPAPSPPPPEEPPLTPVQDLPPVEPDPVVVVPEQTEPRLPPPIVPAPATPAKPVVAESGTGGAHKGPLSATRSSSKAATPPAADAGPSVGEGGSPGAPLRREDYTPKSGSVREMAPRGNMTQIAPLASRRPKNRPMPQLPKLAEPPPPPKSAAAAPAAEAPAQKPEMRLSRESLEQKPLHEHIRQHAEEKKKRGTDDFVEDFTDEVKRPGKPGVRPGVGGAGLISERRTRQAKRSREPIAGEEEELSTSERIRQHRNRSRRHVGPAPAKTSAEIAPPINFRSLSLAMGRPVKDLMGIVARAKGTIPMINMTLDDETALEIALECGVDLHIQKGRDIEQELLDASQQAIEGADRVTRPPIVTILGHVDHGKTTLLDKLRSTNVAAGEKGGITQHIAAYQVDCHGKKITFLDTPGHAAFGEMRARGANVTDIAVLVVAANDGVMPQTIEALNHARAAGVPIVVALNKCDLPDRNEQRVLTDLAAQELLVAEYGGDTELVRTSGLTGVGLDDLLETLLTVAELGELTADPARDANGVCIEAFRDEGRGVLPWLIVQDGTMKKGDIVVCGQAFGRIRSIYDDLDHEIEEAGPSTPVRVAGLDLMPAAGDRFYVVSDLEEARSAAEARRQRDREKQLAQRGKIRSLQQILTASETGEVQELPIIVKADTPGSLEALKGEVQKFQHPEVHVKILHEGVGGVNESDVYLASASGAIIVAFHVVAEDRAEQLAEREGVEIRSYGIIYEITDDIKKVMEGLLPPERVETATGRALVLKVFEISRFGKIAGCRVLNGIIERSNRVRIERDQRILNEYPIASLKRGKDDAKEVRDGLECGIRLDGFDDIKEGDILRAFRVEEIKRTL